MPALFHLALALAFILCSPVSASAEYDDDGLAVFDMIAESDDDLCKKLNGKLVIDPHTIPATCTAGSLLSCDCERTNIWASGKYKNCKALVEDGEITVRCECNEEGTGYVCPGVTQFTTRR